MSSEALKRANGVLDRTYVTRAACEAVANDVRKECTACGSTGPFRLVSRGGVSPSGKERGE